MADLEVQFLGSGDAFGSGGRFNTCVRVRGPDTAFLIDCGASSLVAMRRFGVDPSSIGLILISHLHGDHFGGLPFFLLDAHLVSKRSRPLVIAGPPGLETRLRETMEALFPGSPGIAWRFPFDVVELEPGRPATFGDVAVTPFEVEHACGAPPFALRVACGGKVVAYSGDTAWTEALVPAARGADLFIAEAYFFDKKVRFHLDYATLVDKLDALAPKRMIATHMSQEMLARTGGLTGEFAEDGLVVRI